jgi:hypothetical protein
MNCIDCRERLQAQLDGEAEPGREVEAHLSRCADCRLLQAAARRLRAGLLAGAAPVPPAGMAERVVAGVLEDRRARRRMRRRLGFAVAGLAAAASFALILFLPGGPGQRARRLVEDVISRPSEPVVVVRPADPAQEPPPSLSANVEEATSAVAALARRTADETVSNGQLLVPNVAIGMLPDEVLGPPLESPAQSLRDAGHGVATGLEPVAASARRAWDLFLRDIPPVAPESHSGL